MRKMLSSLLGLLILSSFVFVGCGSDDEDCPACPTFKQTAVMYAQIGLFEDEFGIYGYIIGIDGAVPEIDSVRANGHLVEMETSIGNGLISIEYYGSAGSLDSGDDVEILIYTPTGTCSADVKLLDGVLDNPDIIGWAEESPYDTVDIGTEIDIVWHKVDNADWYMVHRYYSYDSSGTHDSYSEDMYITDTSITIPASATAYDGYFSINVIAMTGPRPDGDGGNITGEAVQGLISGYASEHFQIYVGTGNAWPVAEISAPPPADEIRQPVDVFMNASK